MLAALAGSTRATVVFFTNFGTAYTARIVDVPASTGYGEPIQRLFKFKDGERVVAAFSLDPRVAKRHRDRQTAERGDAPTVHAVAVTSDGYSLRFSLDAVPRAEHARRPPLSRGRPKAPKSSASRVVDRQGNADRGHTRGAGDAVPGDGGELPVGPRAGASS